MMSHLEGMTVVGVTVYTQKACCRPICHLSWSDKAGWLGCICCITLGSVGRAPSQSGGQWHTFNHSRNDQYLTPLRRTFYLFNHYSAFVSSPSSGRNDCSSTQKPPSVNQAGGNLLFFLFFSVSWEYTYYFSISVLTRLFKNPVFSIF